MSNPLYQQMQQQQQQSGSLFQQFQNFRRNFKGDPQQQIRQMMQSGQVNQQQYDRAVQMANQFRHLLGI